MQIPENFHFHPSLSECLQHARWKQIHCNLQRPYHGLFFSATSFHFSPRHACIAMSPKQAKC